MDDSKRAKDGGDARGGDALAMFACPNPDCFAFNKFDHGNLSVCEYIGKDKNIRRLYCNHCQHRFSEREGSLMQRTKLPDPAVVRIVKCLGHGCSIEAAADICQVDPRSVERILELGGKRAEQFHLLQMDKLERGPDAVELDELHGRAGDSEESPAKKGEPHRLRQNADAIAGWVERGFTRPWRRKADS